MIFHPLELEGVFAIDSTKLGDSRGWFTRTYCAEEFANLGMTTGFAQCSASRNAMRGTLRGLHFQAAPHPEAKLIRCVRGAAFDVVVDIRPTSASYGQWVSVEISESNGRSIYIPEGCAHGFQTLTDDTELFYQISVPYRADLARGIRWDDPDIGISWPLPPSEISDRDRTLPVLSAVTAGTVSAVGSRPGDARRRSV